jgi:rhodanese-related sulfurtransferase
MRCVVLILLVSLAGWGRAQQETMPSNPPAAGVTAPAGIVPTNWVLRVIRAERLRTMLQRTNDFVLVDVSPRVYFRDYHIRGSLSVPEEELAQTVRDWPRARRMVIYCLDRACGSGREVVRQLQLMGFADVLLYEGGKREWRSRQYESVGPGKLIEP